MRHFGTQPKVSNISLTGIAISIGCPNATASEAVLQGVISAPGTTAGLGIVDFQVPAGGFSGSLVLKPAGSVGFGSPYPPRMINVEVLEEANADGNFGVATYQPAQAGSTNTEIIAQVAWFTDKNQAIVPASQIQYSALQTNASSSAATKVTPSFLRVYYVSGISWNWPVVCVTRE